jgi:dihydroxyacetone kinase DhaKLM complex PTS-EIIA-like component DhaM
MQASCLISNAPLVEGAVVAALEASLAHSLAVVNQAAETACHLPKILRE